MRYTTIGRSRLEVSRLCLGTMNMGPHADRQQSHRILDTALELGINFLDTANSYGVQGERGLTERILGEWLATGGHREKVVVATKLYEDQDDWPNSGGLSALNIRRACDASLQRLKTDRIDILQMHHVDRRANWEEIWEAFSVLRAQGKILYTGSSNFAAWQLMVAQDAARDSGAFGLISEQSVYNLAQRSIESEVIPALEHLDAGLLAWSPLAGGLLASAPSEVRPGGEGRRSDPSFAARVSAHSDALERGAAAARKHGLTLAQAAIGWLVAQPVLTSAIVGPRRPEHLFQLAEVVDDADRRELWDELDALFPGPGAAPESYAW